MKKNKEISFQMFLILVSIILLALIIFHPSGVAQLWRGKEIIQEEEVKGSNSIIEHFAPCPGC